MYWQNMYFDKFDVIGSELVMLGLINHVKVGEIWITMKLKCLRSEVEGVGKWVVAGWREETEQTVNTH